MAQYERKILVPYLQDVCSMEMACIRIQRNIQATQARINSIEQWLLGCSNTPKKPVRFSFGIGMDSSVDSILYFFGGMIGCILGIIMIWKLGISGIILGLVPMVLSVFAIWYAIDNARANSDRYKAAVVRYKNEVQDLEYHVQKAPQYRQKLAAEQRLLDTQKRQLNQAKALRQRLYAVNIIPSRYRNVHVAYYLYDYFATTRKTDLDKIIQTMLLDEIIQRLDKIIAQMEEVIINQRIQMAMQEKQNQMIAENHRQEMQAFARMERNQERQMDYQNMIARNQEVTNFFLAVDYIRKSK